MKKLAFINKTGGNILLKKAGIHLMFSLESVGTEKKAKVAEIEKSKIGAVKKDLAVYLKNKNFQNWIEKDKLEVHVDGKKGTLASLKVLLGNEPAGKEITPGSEL